AGPDQYGVVLVHRYLVHLDEFELDILDIRLVQVELAFQRPIRDPALALEQGHGLVQDLLEGHGRPSGWGCDGDMMRVEPSAPRLSHHQGVTARQYHGYCYRNCQERTGRSAQRAPGGRSAR